MLWILFALMLAAAALVVSVPLYRRDRRVSGSLAAALLTVLLVPAGVYWQIGSPDADSRPGQVPSIEDMVASLAARLEEDPGDLAGWKMLGRSFLQLRRLPEAIRAYERAVELESGNNAQTLADLGEVLMLQDPDSIGGRAGQLFESAHALAPGNPKALFYAGLAAVNRGEPELAATRWEALLATSPPENIRDILRQRIAELRGEAPPGPALAAESGPGEQQAVVTVNVSLGNDAAGAVDGSAIVFVIARDPAQPSPPIAAVRRRAAELPMAVPLSDSDAMIPGRVPSAFSELEIVARVSSTGEPIARSGDWYGERRAVRGNDTMVDIVIDRRVP